VVASNRVGKEEFEKSSITFYGGSFISGQRGEVLQQVGAALRRLYQAALCLCARGQCQRSTRRTFTSPTRSPAMLKHQPKCLFQ
jgi:predicted amidohydrolase